MEQKEVKLQHLRAERSKLFKVGDIAAHLLLISGFMLFASGCYQNYHPSVLTNNIFGLLFFVSLSLSAANYVLLFEIHNNKKAIQKTVESK